MAKGLEKASLHIYNNIYQDEVIETDTELFFKNAKSIGFLGFGKSNRAVLEYLAPRMDFIAVIRDGREGLSPPDGCIALCGEECFSPPFEDILFLSPSAKRERLEIRRMQEAGTLLCSDAELFFALCEAPVLAVSGSDGKSTTVKMAEAILNRSGTRTLACGNVGVPFINGLSGEHACLVTEISSFTLEYTAPRVGRALITNITENHLDWHGSFGSYIAAKENLLLNAEEAVLSPDSDACLSLIERHRPWGLFSTHYTHRELSAAYPHTRFFFTVEAEHLAVNGEPLMRVAELSKKEPHNIKNALAAIALTYGLFNTGAGYRALTDFSGLSHRIEEIATVCGVRYIDSSIDSSPERTRSTLKALGGRIHILLGGRGKGLSYAPLIEPLLEKQGYVIISGENRRQIASELSVCAALVPRIKVTVSLEDAVRTSVEVASRGDTVLLSPASTSYDAYSNFEERGEKFKEYIKRYTEGIK